MLLARNTGKGFVDISSQAGDVFQKPWVGRGLAIGDIDNDGRLDAVVTTTMVRCTCCTTPRRIKITG